MTQLLPFFMARGVIAGHGVYELCAHPVALFQTDDAALCQLVCDLMNTKALLEKGFTKGELKNEGRYCLDGAIAEVCNWEVPDASCLPHDDIERQAFREKLNAVYTFLETDDRAFSVALAVHETFPEEWKGDVMPERDTLRGRVINSLWRWNDAKDKEETIGHVQKAIDRAAQPTH